MCVPSVLDGTDWDSLEIVDSRLPGGIELVVVGSLHIIPTTPSALGQLEIHVSSARDIDADAKDRYKKNMAKMHLAVVFNGKRTSAVRNSYTNRSAASEVVALSER